MVCGIEELDKNGDISVTDLIKRLPGIKPSGGRPRQSGMNPGPSATLPTSVETNKDEKGSMVMTPRTTPSLFAEVFSKT